jgi:hypothetical protein
MRIRLAIPMSAGLLALAVAPLRATAQLPAKPENLQVLPKDMPTDSVVQIMRGFAGALGVRCQFCHVERQPAGEAPAGPPAGGPPAGPPGGAGPGGGRGGPFQNFDFKADDKANKRTARVMIQMMDTINTRLLAAIPNRDNPPTNVTCYTCHRGVNKPSTIETVLTRTIARSGIDSAISRYRFLRNDMASGRYNFGEQPITDFAVKLRTAGSYDDAIKLLQLNQEFYPNSANIDFELAETYIAKGDKDAGVARLRAMLQKNPNDRRAAARLRQLGVEP